MAITQADPKRGLQTGGLQTGGLQTGSLQTGAASAEKQLLSLNGLGDSFKAGGFAEKDMVRQSIREGLAQDNRLKRAANLAYREAVRSGDRLGALNILLGARKEGIAFGGIQAAGRDRERVIQERGEDLITAMRLRGQPAPGGGGPIAQSDTPATRKEMRLADSAAGILGGAGESIFGGKLPGIKKFDPASGVKDDANPYADFGKGSKPDFEIPTVGRNGSESPRVPSTLPRDQKVALMFRNMFPRGDNEKSFETPTGKSWVRPPKLGAKDKPKIILDSQ